MINYKKELSKIENYWLEDYFFRKEIYECISYIPENKTIYLKHEKCDLIRLKYTDLDFEPVKISVFISGLLFCTSSIFESSFNVKGLRDFNFLGKKLGLRGEITSLFYETFKEKNIDRLYDNCSNYRTNMFFVGLLNISNKKKIYY